MAMAALYSRRYPTVFIAVRREGGHFICYQAEQLYLLLTLDVANVFQHNNYRQIFFM
jgi:hypothetical protein